MTSSSESSLTALTERLRQANEEFTRHYPGETGRRQPVHTVYGGAHLFKSDSAKRLGSLAQRSLEQFAPDATTFARAIELTGDEELHETIYRRVTEKLEREPVEDFRIDFEDGYGNRPDAEEDGHAVSTAEQVARGMAEGSLPPFIGIRIKSLSEELFERAARTLELFVTTLLERTG